jgi:O-antigen/teichoic acid export membrane protein
MRRKMACPSIPAPGRPASPRPRGDLARFAWNTVFTGLAFLSTGIAGIVLVPVLIGTYGIAAFGLLMLGRTFLPSGVLAVVDFGMSEAAMQTVARARGDGNWRAASEQVSLLAVMSIVVGGVLAVVLAAGSPIVARVFHVDAAVTGGFVDMLRVTALALLLLFPGLVLEGVVKGFERFALLRACEVAATLAYAVAAVGLAWSGQPFETNQYAFLAAALLKYAALAVGVRHDLKRAGLSLAKWSTASARAVRMLNMLFFQSKLAGAAQTFAPPLLIGALVGPAGVGVYDVVTRLPRFLKPVLSIVASAITPVAARLEGAGDAERLRRAGKTAFWVVPFVALPPLAGLMVQADYILAAWVGADYARYGVWLGVALLVPVLLVALQFGQAALQIRGDFMRSANRIAAGVVLLQFSVSLGLVFWLDERAFVLGYAVAVAAFYPANLRLLVYGYGLSLSRVTLDLLRVAAPAALLAPVSWFFFRLTGESSIAAHVLGFSVWCIACWWACYVFVLRPGQRLFLRGLFAVLRGRGSQAR